MMNLFEARDLAACAAGFVDACLIGGWCVWGWGVSESGIYLGETRFDQVAQLEFLNKFAEAGMCAKLMEAKVALAC